MFFVSFPFHFPFNMFDTMIAFFWWKRRLLLVLHEFFVQFHLSICISLSHIFFSCFTEIIVTQNTVGWFGCARAQYTVRCYCLFVFSLLVLACRSQTHLKMRDITHSLNTEFNFYAHTLHLAALRCDAQPIASTLYRILYHHLVFRLCRFTLSHWNRRCLHV